MNKQLRDIRQELTATRTKIADIYKEAGGANDLDMNKVTSLDGDVTQKIDALRKLQEKADDLGRQETALREVDLKAREDALRDAENEAREGVSGTATAEPETKSFQDRIVATGVFNDGRGRAQFDMRPDDLKADFTRSAGYPTESIRRAGVVPINEPEPMLIDVVPVETTTQASVRYTEHTTATNMAAARAEGAKYAESTHVLTDKSVVVESIGHYIPVTDEQLADVPEAGSWLFGRLQRDLRIKVSGFQLNGTGTTPNIQGILTATGINTYDKKTAENNLDAIARGLQAIEVTGNADANVIVMHPSNWWDIRLTKANNVYLFGPPSESGATSLWGLTRVKSQELTVDDVLCLDTSWLYVAMRQDALVEVGLADDDFLRGKQSVRATVRLAQVIVRPSAFTKVDLSP